MVSRIAFALEDLEREIRDLSPDSSMVELRLDPPTYRHVTAALASHFGRQLLPGGDDGVTRVRGVVIIQIG